MKRKYETGEIVILNTGQKARIKGYLSYYPSSRIQTGAGFNYRIQIIGDVFEQPWMETEMRKETKLDKILE